MARKPEEAAGSNKKKLIVACFVLSYGSIFSLIIFLDLMDNRIRTPKDVLNALGAPASWPISDYRLTGNKNISFSRVTLDDPTNVVARAIRSLSIKLDRERVEQDAKIATFTGVDSVSGVTEILLNTSYILTKFCKKILIIEANFVSPSMASQFKEYKNRLGLFDLLYKDKPLSECIFHDDERKLDILFANHKASRDELSNFNHLKFNELLEELKNRYDFIIVDSSPILVNDFTEYLMLKTDIGVLVIQGDRSVYNDLYRSIEILSRLELSAIAAVLNWGAPRNRNRYQVILSTLLWPIQRMLIKQPEKTDVT